MARQFARLNKLTYEETPAGRTVVNLQSGTLCNLSLAHWLLLKELFGHVDSDGDGALDEEDQKRGTDDQSSSELRSLGVHLLLLNDRQG